MKTIVTRFCVLILFALGCFGTADAATTAAQEISQLSTLSSDNARAGVQAQNWLHLLDNKIAQTEALWGSGTQALQAGAPEENQLLEQKSKDVDLSGFVQVAPNPSVDFFQFTVRKSATTQLAIFNTTGQLVEQYILEAGETTFDWKPNVRENGLYFYRVLDAEGNIFQMGKLVFLGL